MSLNINLIFIILFYFIGSVPFALMLPKLFGLGDIRNIGSKNVGATNVLRTGNKFLAVLVLCLDILKGLLPFLILNSFFENIGLLHSILLCHFAILGHIFPVWLKFKGGKGVAVYVGIILALSFKLALIFGVTWLIVLFLFKYSSLSSILASLSLIIYNLFFDNNFQNIFLILFFLIIIYTHKQNIFRIKDKKETKIKF